MTSILKFPAFGVMFAILTLFGAGCVAPSVGDDTEDVAAFLQEVVDARDDAMLSGDVTIYETYFASATWPSASPLANEYDPAILTGMRDRMIEQDTDIVDLSSAATIMSIDRDGDILTVRFTIESSMLVSVAGQVMAEPSLSRGEYRAVLHREAARFLITSFNLDYGDAPMFIESDVPTTDHLGVVPTILGDLIDFDAPTARDICARRMIGGPWNRTLRTGTWQPPARRRLHQLRVAGTCERQAQASDGTDDASGGVASGCPDRADRSEVRPACFA